MFARVYSASNDTSMLDIIACPHGVDKKNEGNKNAATETVVGGANVSIAANDEILC